MKKKILIADDDRGVREILAAFAKIAGLEPTIVSNGREALAVVTESLNEPFDLIFSDRQMPEMDGFELYRRIRHSLRLQVPMVCITGRAALQDIADLRETGFDEVITKPFRKEDIFEIFERFVPDLVAA